MRCQDIICHKDKQLRGGKCIYHPIYLMPTCFVIFFNLIPEGMRVYLSDMDTDDFKNDVRNFILPNEIIGIQTDLVIFYKTSGVKRRIEKVIAFIRMSVTQNVITFKIDAYVKSILDNHGGTLKVVLHVYPKKADLYAIFRIESAVYRYSIDRWTTVLYTIDRFNKHIELVDTQEIASRTCTEENVVVINKLYTCAFLELSMRDLAYRLEQDLLYLDNYGGQTSRDNHTAEILPKWSFEIEGDIIRICLDDFMKLYMSVTEISHLRSTVASPETVDPKQILSLACVCLSIISLLFTLATYFSLPVLRSSPGVNNLILSIFLLLAQSVYQFGAGQTTVSYVFCAIIGAVCHFLWLCVVFSLNLCSIQMFIIFKKQIKVTPQFNLAQTARGIIYVICMSVFFVITNLAVSLIRSNGSNPGYGSEQICYINSSLMQAVAFVIPSAISLIVNIILFSYVVYKIRQIGEASVRINKERNYLGVYARLSTLTGVTWIFGYLRILFELEVLEYLFIAFNASQGVFIMIAFVLNRRVIALMCGKSMPSSLATTRSENGEAEP